MNGKTVEIVTTTSPVKGRVSGYLIVELQGVHANKESLVVPPKLIIRLPKLDQGSRKLLRGHDICDNSLQISQT